MRHAHARFGSHPAESMIETIIAITVIIIGTAGALSMLRSSISGNELVAQKEVAINIALEGLDAVKNIRDTNYLLFADAADDCWNTYGATAADCSDGTAYREGWDYLLSRDFTSPSLDWSVTRATTNTGYMTLYGIDTDGDGSTNIELYGQSGVSESGFTALQTKAFRRIMTIEYVDTDGDGSGDANDAAFDATVTVSWTDSGNTHSITLTRTISHVY